MRCRARDHTAGVSVAAYGASGYAYYTEVPEVTFSCLYALVLRAPGHETDIINVCFSRWGILCCCIYIYGRLWLLCG